jgi:hypothetical protein
VHEKQQSAKHGRRSSPWIACPPEEEERGQRGAAWHLLLAVRLREGRGRLLRGVVAMGLRS